MKIYPNEKDVAHKLFPKNIIKVKGKTKLESSPETERDETMFLGSKSFIIKKPSISTETKHKGVQSHKYYTTEKMTIV